MPNVSPTLVGKRAVIVEDEGITQMQLRMILTNTGVQIAGTASTAQEGIDLVLNLRPDLVLMDINMPGKLNGLDAAELIIGQFPVCIVMLTAYSEDEYRRRAAAIPTSGYLLKPVAWWTLISELEKCFTTREQERD